MRVVMHDPRLQRHPGPVSACSTAVVSGLSAAAFAILAEWLPPFVVCTHADEGFATPSTAWQVFAVQGHGPESPSTREPYTLKATRGTVRVEGGTAVSVARGVLAILRGVFKAAAIAAGGTNIHAGCVVGSGRAALIIANRGEGKTTSILAALAARPLSLLANDQLVLVPGDAAWVAWGYPAVIKVREGTYRMLDLTSAAPLWHEPDTLGTRDEPSTAVHSLTNLCLALGKRTVVAEAPVAVAIRYRQSPSPDLFDVRLHESGGEIWHDVAALPFETAYRSELVDAVRTLTGPLPATGQRPWPPELPMYDIRCGTERLVDFGAFLQRMTG